MTDVLDCLTGDEIRDLKRLAFARTRMLADEASVRRFVILELAVRTFDGPRLTPLGQRIVKEMSPCARPS